MEPGREWNLVICESGYYFGWTPSRVSLLFCKKHVNYDLTYIEYTISLKTEPLQETRIKTTTIIRYKCHVV